MAGRDTTTRSPQDGAVVIDARGARGTLEGTVENEHVLVRFDQQAVRMPAYLLEPADDGTYRVPVDVSQLEGATTSRDVSTEARERGSDDERATVPVVQEELRVGKRTVEEGAVRVTKRVFEHEEHVDMPLEREDVEVERVPVGRVVDSAPPIREEGDTIVVPLLREELVVEKRLVLHEELHLRKRRTRTNADERVTLRREDVEIDRSPAPAGRREDRSKT